MEALSSLPGARIGQDFSRFLGHENPEVRYLALLKITENKSILDDGAVQRTLTDLGSDEDERIRLRILDLMVESSRIPATPSVSAWVG